jgi:cob(I)alamin adenosyltransferase
MTKKSTIYTKTGDKGTTKLYSGQTVFKGNKKVHVLGQFDHLNSNIGVTYEKIKSIYYSSWIGVVERILTHIPADQDELISLKAIGLVLLISIVGSLYSAISFASSMGFLIGFIITSHKVISIVRRKCAEHKASVVTLKHLETIMFDIKNIMTLVANPVEENNHRYVEDPSVSVKTFQKIILDIPIDKKKFVETYNHVNSLFERMIGDENIAKSQREELLAKGFIRDRNNLVYTVPVPPETKINIALEPNLDNIACENKENKEESTTEVKVNKPDFALKTPEIDMVRKFVPSGVLERPSDPNAKLMDRIKEQFAEHSLTRLEEMIDLMDISEQHPIRCFLFPVGSELTAQIHTVRTLCRSVELDLYSSSEDDVYNISCGKDYNLLIAKYMNRLSSYLFVLSRWATVIVANEKELEFDQYKTKK